MTACLGTSPVQTSPPAAGTFGPYVPRLVADWVRHTPQDLHRSISGSLLLADVSGFTRLTERLARRGRIGAEEISDTLNATFARLLTVAYNEHADLLAWGGDALLLFFDGDGHAARAATTATRMQRAVIDAGRLHTSAGPVRLRMSIGIHSDQVDVFLVGDPGIHRQLIVSGPAASTVVRIRAQSPPGRTLLSDETAAMLPARLVGVRRGAGRLLVPEPGLVVDLRRPQPPRFDEVESEIAMALPPPVRSHLLAPAGVGEHRGVTIGFVGMCGTDDLLRRKGADVLADALDECVRTVQHAAQHHGVTFLESDPDDNGGKIMLTAGAPRSAGHDEERMLRAVGEAVQRAGILPLRAGVNRGHVFTGDFGPAFRRTYSVKGDAVNLAARLTSKALPGQVLTVPAVIDSCQSEFDTTALPPFPVKGKRAPVQAVAVGKPRAQRRPGRTKGRLVGREEELAELQAALASARAGAGRLVELVGEPGLGKSSLVEELRTIASASGDHVLLTTGEEYESSTPYYPFRALLRQALGVAADSTDEELAEQLQARVADRAPELLPWLPLLGVPLDLDLPSTPQADDLAEQFRKARLEDAVTEFLSAVLPVPVVLVVEDAHQLDVASADLLTRLVQDLQRRHWLVVVTRREDTGGFVAPDSPATVRRNLPPLPHAAALALLSQSTEQAPLPPHTLEAFAQRAQGNPLFLRELVLAARATGSVEDLPDSVEGVITAQLDRLGWHERTVLRYAAVLGMSFEEGLLCTMLGDRRLPPLSELGGFLVAAPDGRIRFQHALLRDAAYEGLPYGLRRQLHARAGELLEGWAADPDDDSEILALHFFAAGRFDKAWRYATVAGRRARAKYANAQAADFLRRAADAARRVEGLDGAELARALEDLGEVQMMLGLLQDASSAYRAARRHVDGDTVWNARLLLEDARAQRKLGRFSHALRLLTRGLRLLDGVDTQQAQAVRSLLTSDYAFCRVSQGKNAEALELGRSAARQAESVADRPALARAYLALHAAHALSGLAADVSYGELALQLYEQEGDLLAQAQCHNNLGALALIEGRWDEALTAFRRAREEFQRVGDSLFGALAAYNEADVHLRRGELDVAEALLREALPVARAAHDQDLVATVTRELGRVLVRAGSTDHGLARLRQAREIFTELGELQEVVDADAAVAECLLLRGQPEEAAELAADCIARAKQLGAATLLPTLYRVRGFALLSAGRAAAARDAFADGVSLSADTGALHERGFLLAGLADAARLDGDPAATEFAAESQSLLASLGIQAPVAAFA